MRLTLVFLGGVAAGIASIVVSLLLLLACLFAYGRYVAGIGPSNGSVGWDVASLLGPNWRIGAVGIPIVIFGIGCSLGFWFFSKRLLH